MKTILALVLVFATASSVTAITMDTVPVGNPGNAPDLRYNLDQRPEGYGAVDYVFQIGKYEVTAGQYTEFLNAVAKDDPNELYNTFMANIPAWGVNIQRTGSSPNFSYSVAADWANRPVTWVSFWDAARFANWLHNGQPIGPQGPGTTEDGAYHDVGNQDLFGRNGGAKFFIPTEDEWYKAAYHDETTGSVASYFDYPTGTSVEPQHALPDLGNHANHLNAAPPKLEDWTIASPYFRTEVGEFVNSASPYGTFDQGGNVWEWNETVLSISSRVRRGGAFVSLSNELAASYRYFQPTLSVPTYEAPTTGFRIASIAIPEPSTLLLTLAAMAAISSRRRKLCSHDRV